MNNTDRQDNASPAPQISLEDRSGLVEPASEQSPQNGTQGVPEQVTANGDTTAAREIDLDAVTTMLHVLNGPEGRYFVKDTFKAKNHQGSIAITMEDRAEMDYAFRLSKSANGGIIAFRPYGEEEELLEARPYVSASYAEIFSNSDLPGDTEDEIISQAMFGMMDRLDDPQTKWNKDMPAVGFLYFGDGNEDINFALANYVYVNPDMVDTLDELMQRDTLTADTVVYRGFHANPQLVASIKAGGYNDPAYLTVSPDEATARRFFSGLTQNTWMKMTLPAGTKCHDASMEASKSITLPRRFDLSSVEWEFSV